MKNLLLLIIGAALVGSVFGSERINANSMNPIIGNISFVSKFGFEPTSQTDETLRIKTHLEFVEKLLRSRDVAHLSEDKRTKRTAFLDHLHDYWQAERFPTNQDYYGRKPCFIDADKNICAVGYLLEKSEGLDVANEINSEYQYAEIFEMDSETLAAWVEESGLDLIEFAMIQPTYSGPPWWQPPPPPSASPFYRGVTSVMVGANASLMTLNGIQMIRSNNSLILPAVSLVSGTGQLTAGIIEYVRNGKYIPDGQGINHSLLNIGVGSATLGFSLFNLITSKLALKKKKSKPKFLDNSSLNIFSYPMQNDKVAVGFVVTKNF